MNQSSYQSARRWPWRLWGAVVLITTVSALSVFRAAPPVTRDEAQLDLKMAQFFAYLRPQITRHNRQLSDLRNHLLALQQRYVHESDEWVPRDRRFVDSLSVSYRINAALSRHQRLQELTRRVDIVPPSLILAQSAIESSWGQSPLARQAHNWFGRHCFRPGCGILDPETGKLRFAAFRRPGLGVRTHSHDLNTHDAYTIFRNLRAEDRANGQPLRGGHLAAGLGRYSIRGDLYIQQVQSFIRRHALEP